MISLDEGIRSSELYDQIMNRICDSGLYEKLDQINVVTCGDLSKLKTNFNSLDKVSHVKHDNDIKNFEFPTLQQIYEDCQKIDNEDKILYLHLKGTSKKIKNKNDDVWLEKMLNVVVNRHFECIESLDTYNCVGTMYFDQCVRDNKVARCYAGNFWWTKTSHIKKLPNPDWKLLSENFQFLIKGRYNKNELGPISAAYRYLAEFWIGLHNLTIEDENHGMHSIS